MIYRASLPKLKSVMQYIENFDVNHVFPKTEISVLKEVRNQLAMILIFGFDHANQTGIDFDSLTHSTNMKNTGDEIFKIWCTWNILQAFLKGRAR